MGAETLCANALGRTCGNEEAEVRYPEPKPQTTDEIIEQLRSNLCHDNCICSDSDWCIQRIAVEELERFRAMSADDIMQMSGIVVE
jgi:hypothetical protein